MALVTRCGVRYSSLLMCYFSASHLSISHHNYRRRFWGRSSSPFAASFDNGNLSVSPRSRCTPLPYHFRCFGRRLPARIRFLSAWGVFYLWPIDEIAEELWGEIDLHINGGTPEYTWEKVSLGFYCIVWLNIIKKAIITVGRRRGIGRIPASGKVQCRDHRCWLPLRRERSIDLSFLIGGGTLLVVLLAEGLQVWPLSLWFPFWRYCCLCLEACFLMGIPFLHLPMIIPKIWLFPFIILHFLRPFSIRASTSRCVFDGSNRVYTKWVVYWRLPWALCWSTVNSLRDLSGCAWWGRIYCFCSSWRGCRRGPASFRRTLDGWCNTEAGVVDEL